MPPVEAEVSRVPPSSLLEKKFDEKKIKRIDLDLTPVVGDRVKLAYVLDNVFTPKECKALIDLSEETGYDIAVINGIGGTSHYAPGYRDGERVIIDDVKFAKKLMKRIEPFLPTTFQDEKLVEINERMRFLKYSKPGDKFAKHYDGCYTRPDGSATTLITLQIYLNGGFEGGETSFMYDLRTSSRDEEKDISVPVVPEAGRILVFEHNILHEGSVMRSGTKYTIRMDVLYTDKWATAGRHALDLMNNEGKEETPEDESTRNRCHIA